MSKKTNTLLASAVAAGILMMGAEAANAAGKTKAAPANAAAGAIESRLKQMEDQMNAMKSELSRVRAESASSAKVADLEQKVANQASAAKKQKEHANLLFFRGGYADQKQNRADLQTSGNVLGTGTQSTHDARGQGWYVGAGFDFHLTEDVWGLTDKAEVFGELMVDYKDFGTVYNTLTQATIAGTNLNKAQVTMLSISASPKVKFNPHGDFRPWIIPVGLGIHVISPPSNGVTVLNPGLMMGVGADYKVWKDIYAGADFRYNFTGNALAYKDNHGLTNANGKPLRGVNTDGFTTGAYLGVGF